VFYLAHICASYLTNTMLFFESSVLVGCVIVSLGNWIPTF
jgi:hypothetical protein